MEKRKVSLVTIIGKPNAGKSTLLNYMVGQKIAIVTPKVQTTRSSITGIATIKDTQLVFIDTPGIFSAKTRLEKAMVRCAWSNVVGADDVLFIIDSCKEFDEAHGDIISNLKEQGISPIFIINKIDLKKSNAEDILYNIKKIIDNPIIFPISALKGANVDRLIEYLISNAKEKEWLYEADALTNLPSRFIASEITREQLFMQMQQELPYRLTVESESWENLQDGSVKINQVIIVSRQNYKSMILGNKGERIKNISMKAREEISRALNTKVHLFLFVKVREDWDNNPLSYEYMGLQWKK